MLDGNAPHVQLMHTTAVCTQSGYAGNSPVHIQACACAKDKDKQSAVCSMGLNIMYSNAHINGNAHIPCLQPAHG